MPRTVLQAIPLSEEDSDPQLSASSGDAVTETSDDGGENLQPDFAGAEQLHWLCAKKGKKLHVSRQFTTTEDVDFATPLCGTTAVVHGWTLGLGAATARASDPPWCALCLRRVAARSPAIAAALSRHPEDGDDPMNIFDEKQEGGTVTPP